MQTKQLQMLDPVSTLIQGLAYAGAGVIGTACHYTIMVVLLQAGIFHVVQASTVGAVAGGVINYLLAHRQVFRSTVEHRIAALRFTIVAILGIGLNAAVLGISAPALGAFSGQITASVAVLLCGFTLNRSWSFRE